MNATSDTGERSLFIPWVRATTIGWLVGFALVLLLSMAWELVFEGAQFMVGVGMGAGVGFFQARVIRRQIDKPMRWFVASTVGLGIPFLAWDVVRRAGLEFPFMFPTCVLAGSLLVGILHARLLRAYSDAASRWIPVTFAGWGIPLAVITLNDQRLLPDPFGVVVSMIAMFFGGAILGLVTGKTMASMFRRADTP